MPIGLLVKLVAGWFFYYVYSTYYGSQQLTADAGQFLKESKLLYDVFWQSPSDYIKFMLSLDNSTMIMNYLEETTHWDGGPNSILNDSKNVIKIHSIVQFFSFGLPSIHILFSCFVSLFGVFHLTKAFQNFVSIQPKWLFLILLFAPSTLFWTSGLLKEPFLFLGIGLFCRALLFKEDGIWKKIAYGLVGILLLIGFKPYTFICILAAALVFLLFSKIKINKVAFGIFALFIILSASLVFLPKNNKIVNTLSAKQSDFIGISSGGNFIRTDSCFFIFSDSQMDLFRIEDSSYYLTKAAEVEFLYPFSKNAPQKTIAYPNQNPWHFGYHYDNCGSYIPIRYIDNSPTTLFKNIPEAMINATIRPFIGDPGSNFKYFAMLEIWLLFCALIVVIFKRRTINRTEFALIMALIVFSILMLLLIGWVTPVLGAIVRYRFPALLAIMIIGVILIPTRKTISQ